jgi:hypothetical protein
MLKQRGREGHVFDVCAVAVASYLEALDQSSMLEKVENALHQPSLVILQGAIVWPAVEPLTTKLGSKLVRRVYLKKMAHLMPDFWVDEDWILDPEFWPPTDFHRSMYRYHAERRPWLHCDLIIERIEDKPAFDEVYQPLE